MRDSEPVNFFDTGIEGVRAGFGEHVLKGVGVGGVQSFGCIGYNCHGSYLLSDEGTVISYPSSMCFCTRYVCLALARLTRRNTRFTEAL